MEFGFWRCRGPPQIYGAEVGLQRWPGCLSVPVRPNKPGPFTVTTVTRGHCWPSLQLISSHVGRAF